MELSDERRAQALNYIKRSGLLTTTLSEDARVVAVLGTLVCNDYGLIPKSALLAALEDPSALAAARTLLAEARR